MTDDELVERATAKLLGEFYVGQRVRHEGGECGTVVVVPSGRQNELSGILVEWDAKPHFSRRVARYAAWSLKPL